MLPFLFLLSGWIPLPGFWTTPSALAQTPPPTHRLSFYEAYPSNFRSPEMSKPRSKASKYPEVSNFLETYSFIEFQHARIPPMAAQPGSLAANENQLAFLLMDLRFLNVPASKFIQQNPLADFSSNPVILAEFLSDKRKAMEFLLQKFHNLVSRDSPEFATRLKIPLVRFKVGMDRQLNDVWSLALEPIGKLRLSSIEQRSVEILKIAHRMETDFSGLLGELYMAVSLPGTLSVSTRIRDIPELDAVFAKLKASINPKILASPGVLKMYEREYPLLFRSPVEQMPSTEPIEKRLILIWDRIMKEEIDVFGKVGTEYFLGESKVSSKPFDLEAFAKTCGHHTRAEQAESKREIAMLLREAGLKVKYEYMVSSGFDPELAGLLRGQGWILHTLSRGCTYLLERPKPDSSVEGEH